MNPPVPTSTGRSMTVVMYHYVRDLPGTPFPRIKGMLSADFRKQVDLLRGRYEMASLESALAFLAGTYRPARDLCLLTFDDGLKEHGAEVAPLLAERNIQGLFFLPTACLEESRVVSVHKNHFLMAALEFGAYRKEFLERLGETAPGVDTAVDDGAARRVYRWDSPEVARFKYLLNFRVPEDLREEILCDLFRRHLGEEEAFARELYLSWEDARRMQGEGMLMGGHSHNHVALATLEEGEQESDLRLSAELLHSRLSPQGLWPFSYPYGKRDAFNAATVRVLREAGFACAFTTEVGSNAAGDDPFMIRRIDAKDVEAKP